MRKHFVRNDSLMSLIIMSVLFTPVNAVAVTEATGTAGPQGPIGKTGATGPQGPIGKTGATGPQGPIGKTGVTGPQGPVGAKGANGNAGLSGAKGPTGDKGPIGNQGATGIKGPVGGAKGDTGAQGPSGTAGAKGLTGNTGLTGAMGTKGATGNTGLTGSTGATGAKGPTGPGLPQTGNVANNSTLKNCNGIPTWVASSSTCPFLMGDKGPAGGIVFYLNDNTGLHGLEAAPADLNSTGYTWGCWGWVNSNLTWTTVGSTGDAVGSGAANKAAIIASCGGGGGTGNGNPYGWGTVINAAAAAEAYALNGFTDWYLPSKGELNLLYIEKAMVGGFANAYWSSTEFGSNFGSYQEFSFGYQFVANKNATLSVRAIRSF
jgi:hypothetical protein